MSGARRAALVALATALVLAAFVGGRAARSDDDGAGGSAPAAEVEDPGKGTGLGSAAGLPRLRRDQPPGGTGPTQDTGSGATSNDSSPTQQTQQPDTPKQQPDPPSNDTESFGGGTN